MINRRNIKDLESWDFNRHREYDYIYILPTSKRIDGYTAAYYIGQIGDEIKIIDFYDCGNNVGMNVGYSSSLKWDFENIKGGIRMWNWYGNKLLYSCGAITTSKIGNKN